MHDNIQYLEEDFIIWNGTLGVRDFVTIGEIDSTNNTAWLDDPYEMVGPFCLDELMETGQISFAACVVMSQDKWREEQSLLRQEAYKNYCKSQQQFHEDISKHNKKRREQQSNLEQVSQKEYRELLCLPIEGVISVSQIKAAFRKIAKTAHPDVGGSHGKFIRIIQARDALLEK